MKKYTIEDARNREVAIENDGTIEQMDEALRLIFSEDPCCKLSKLSSFIKTSRFFYAGFGNNRLWDYSNKTNLPTQSVKDFLTPEWKPVRGEMVLVLDTDLQKWEPKIFIAEITGDKKPFLCVLNGHEDEFNGGFGFYIARWSQMKRIETPETERIENPNEMIKVTVTLNGETINPMQLSRKQWGKIRTNQ